MKIFHDYHSSLSLLSLLATGHDFCPQNRELQLLLQLCSTAAAKGDSCALDVAQDLYLRTCCTPRVGSGLPSFRGCVPAKELNLTPHHVR